MFHSAEGEQGHASTYSNGPRPKCPICLEHLDGDDAEVNFHIDNCLEAKVRNESRRVLQIMFCGQGTLGWAENSMRCRSLYICVRVLRSGRSYGAGWWGAGGEEGARRNPRVNRHQSRRPFASMNYSGSGDAHSGLHGSTRRSRYSHGRVPSLQGMEEATAAPRSSTVHHRGDTESEEDLDIDLEEEEDDLYGGAQYVFVNKSCVFGTDVLGSVEPVVTLSERCMVPVWVRQGTTCRQPSVCFLVLF